MRGRIADLMAGYRGRRLARHELAGELSALAAATPLPAGAQPGFAGRGPAVASNRPNAVFVPAVAGAGADDRQALQDAIDAAAAAGGGQVPIDGQLSIGSSLTMKTDVELVGTGRIGSSIGALPSFVGGSLIVIEADATHVSFLELTLDTAGLAHGIVFGAGCSRILISGMRITGWDPAIPGFSAVFLDAPPDPLGSNRRIRNVVISSCDFDQIGNGVKISSGASHVDVVGCRFRGMRRRAIWLTGSGSLSSSHVRISGNTVMDFPFDPDLSFPITVGGLGDEPHEYIHVSRNVVIGNGSFNGPGGFGAGDQITVHCLRHSQIVCNASIDSAEIGFVVIDSSDLLLFGNVSIASDGSGFLLKARLSRCVRVQFIANYALNNFQNRQQGNHHEWVKCGYLVRDDGDGVVDTLFLGNYSWDDQEVKTQNYALSIGHDTVHSTLLTGNLWRPAQHGIDTVFNRGRKTTEAIYEAVPRLPD